VTTETSDRLWTVPNALSLARLLGVPLFVWLVLAEYDGWALGLLVFAGLSDWLDGKLARMLDQTSRLGTLLDPAADRLYIFATLIGLTVRHIVPPWLTGALVAREVFMGLLLLILYGHGYRAQLPVHFVGKAATLALLYAFPLLLLGDQSGGIGTVAKIVGWSFAMWGTALYWWGACLYAVQARRLVPTDLIPADIPPDPDEPAGHTRAEDPKGAAPAP
jgi:cardiolipin synthase